jgi:peroxiredoxin
MSVPSLPSPPNRARPWLLSVLLLLIAIPFGLAALLLTNNGAGNGGAGSSFRTLSAGMDAPEFTLTAQDGRSFSLANYKGRAVFLVFVPSWEDTDTVEQLRSLAKATHEFDMAGAKVLAISSDAPKKAKALHERERLPFPLLADSGFALAKRYTIPNGYRTTFVVDPEGRVKYRVGASIVEPERHGRQLIEISKCCMDEVMAARAGGIGKPVGDYSLPRVDTSGQMETLYGDGTQKATVVLFLSVGCPCSNAYNQRVRELVQEFAPKGIRFIGIFANADETMSQIAAHAREQGFTFPIVKDDKALGADHFHASVTPEAFLLDNQRILRYAGRLDDNRDATQVKHHDLRDALTSLLAGQTVPESTRAFGCGIVRPNTAL